MGTLQWLANALHVHHCLPLQSLSLLLGLYVQFLQFLDSCQFLSTIQPLHISPLFEDQVSLYSTQNFIVIILFFQSAECIYLCDDLINLCLLTLDTRLYDKKTLSVYPQLHSQLLKPVPGKVNTFKKRSDNIALELSQQATFVILNKLNMCSLREGIGYVNKERGY